MDTAVINLNNKKHNVTFGTVVFTHIPNPFEPLERVSRTEIHGSPLHTYLEGFCLGQEYMVLVNGKEMYDFDYVVKPNDNVIYTPIVAGGGGGGGKDIIRVVALIALAVAAPYLAGAAMSATAGFVGAGVYGGLSGALIFYGLQAGIMMLGGMLINSILPPTKPSFANSMPEAESDSYSWSGVTTNRDLNKPIPVLYGTFMLGGTVINNRFTYPNGDDWISTQLALCHGPIENIRPQDVFVGDVPFSSIYTSTIDGTYKQVSGTFDQPIMSGFDDSSFNNATVAHKVTYTEPYYELLVDTFTIVENPNNYEFIDLYNNTGSLYMTPVLTYNNLGDNIDTSSSPLAVLEATTEGDNVNGKITYIVRVDTNYTPIEDQEFTVTLSNGGVLSITIPANQTQGSFAVVWGSYVDGVNYELPNYPSDSIYDESPYTFTSVSTDIDNFRLHFEFPKGLYTMSKQGDLSENTVRAKVEYRKVGDTEWFKIYRKKYVYKTQYEYTDVPPSYNTGGGGYEGDGYGFDGGDGYGFGDGLGGLGGGLGSAANGGDAMGGSLA